MFNSLNNCCQMCSLSDEVNEDVMKVLLKQWG